MRVAVAGPYGHERVTAWQDGADAQRKNTAGGFVWGLYTKVAKRVDDTAMFPDNATAERWFVEQRWHGVIACPSCGSVNVQTGCKHKSMPYRCREKECAQKFSVKTGTVMECAKVGYQDWLLAAFLLMTSLKSVSSMKLHRDLGVSQKTAWFLAQRLRVALSQDGTLFAGPVKVDETYFGGRRRNMSNTKRKGLADTGAWASRKNGGDRRQRSGDQARRGRGSGTTPPTRSSPTCTTTFRTSRPGRRTSAAASAWPAPP